jgi:hypothetical protein
MLSHWAKEDQASQAAASQRPFTNKGQRRKLDTLFQVEVETLSEKKE